jgi:hypothetical protein
VPDDPNALTYDNVARANPPRSARDGVAERGELLDGSPSSARPPGHRPVDGRCATIVLQGRTGIEHRCGLARSTQRAEPPARLAGMPWMLRSAGPTPGHVQRSGDAAYRIDARRSLTPRPQHPFRWAFHYDDAPTTWSRPI